MKKNGKERNSWRGIKIKRAFVTITLALGLVLSLASCGNVNNMGEVDGRDYIMVNGLTPSEMMEIVSDFIMGVYMPSSDEDINHAIEVLSQIATESEIETLRSEVGKYDESKRATLSNVDVSIATPDNTSTKNYRVLVEFTINMESGLKQNLLLEFQCDYGGRLNSHTLWVNNPDI